MSQVGSGVGGILATTRTVNHSVVIYSRITYSYVACQLELRVKISVKLGQKFFSQNLAMTCKLRCCESLLRPPSPRQATCAQSTDPTVCLLLTQISFYIDLHLSN